MRRRKYPLFGGGITRTGILTLLFILPALAACITADPAAVARAVNATLTAALTPTPIVVVVTALVGQPPPIPTTTPDPAAQATLAAATQTLAAATAAGSATAALPAPASATPGAPTSTPAATAGAPVPLGPVMFAEDFSRPGGWATSEDEHSRIAVADGKLAITLKTQDRFTLVYNISRRGRDFYASVVGTAAACLFRDRYGLLFRVRDARNYYQFEMDCDGRYRLAKVEGGALTPLRDWTADAAIRKGEGATNELGVRAAGNVLQVFANGQPLLRVTDSAYDEGSFGLYAGSGLSGAYTAAFDDLRVWELAK